MLNFKSTKRIKIISLLSALVIILGGYFLYQQTIKKGPPLPKEKKEAPVIPKEEKEVPREEPLPPTEETPPEEEKEETSPISEEKKEAPPKEEEFSLKTFMEELKNEIINKNLLGAKDYYDQLVLRKMEEIGFNWLVNGEVKVINGYELNLAIPRMINGKEVDTTITNENVGKIVEYFTTKGFNKNDLNSCELADVGYKKIGLEKGGFKCLIFLDLAGKAITIDCGDIIKDLASLIYQEITNQVLGPFQECKSLPKVVISKAIEDFALGGIVSEFLGGGAAIIWKKEEGRWKSIIVTQDEFSCKELLENKVPPLLLTSSKFPEAICFFYDCIGYENECKEYCKEYHETVGQAGNCNYQALYQEKFGKE